MIHLICAYVDNFLDIKIFKLKKYLTIKDRGHHLKLILMMMISYME